MNLNIEKLHDDFGARIHDVNLKTISSDSFFNEISAAIDQYSFLHFPQQSLDDQRHLSLTKILGKPEPNHIKFGQQGVIDYFFSVGNVQDNGTVFSNKHQNTIFQTGNNMWHSDSSFREIPSFVTMMYAYEVPTRGGQTNFASCRAAYARLPETTKLTIDNLTVVHDYVFSRSKISSDAVTKSHAISLPAVRQKLVRKNAKLDKKNYYIGSHAKSIVGWNFLDSRILLDDLLRLATQKHHIYSHTWKPGDFVIWDNRCLLHRGAGYDADKYRRKMRQTRVRGLISTLKE